MNGSVGSCRLIIPYISASVVINTKLTTTSAISAE